MAAGQIFESSRCIFNQNTSIYSQTLTKNVGPFVTFSSHVTSFVTPIVTFDGRLSLFNGEGILI